MKTKKHLLSSVSVLAFTIIAVSATPALALQNTLTGNNPIEGVTIITNNDSSGGEDFSVIDGASATTTISSTENSTTLATSNGNSINVDNTNGVTLDGTNAGGVQINGGATGTVISGTGGFTTSGGTANINSTGTSNTNIGNTTGTTTVTGTTTINSANGFSSTTFNNAGTSIIADNDASAGNGRGTFAVNQNSASLLVTNSAGNTHGLQVGTTSTVLSGGTTSTTFTLDDNGATLASTGGGPAQLHGVADGTSPFDAVNVRQLNRSLDEVKGGVASVAAMANIPTVDTNKQFSLGIGYGNFMTESAFAVGGSVRVADSAVIKGSVGSSIGETSVGVGAGFSW